MKNPHKISFLLVLSGIFMVMTSFRSDSGVTKYKCMIQTVNYTGENAYIIVSLMNPQGKYDHTLSILGDDPEWYHLFDEWWSYFGQEERDVDAITGATVGSGQRKIITFEIDNAKVDKGYKIRFETQVEDQDYYPADVEIPVTSEMPKTPQNGKGYIRYVRLMPA